MSEQTEKTPGQVILGWWGTHIGDRDSAAARALAARLRRAGPVETLCERAVYQLADSLDMRDPDRIMTLVSVLAHVRTHRPATFARALGWAAGDGEGAMDARFQRLMRADRPELATGLIRALPMIDHSCNVAALGTDLIFWSDKVRTRWSFHYFGAETSESLTETTQ